MISPISLNTSFLLIFLLLNDYIILADYFVKFSVFWELILPVESICLFGHVLKNKGVSFLFVFHLK